MDRGSGLLLNPGLVAMQYQLISEEKKHSPTASYFVDEEYIYNNEPALICYHREPFYSS
jgi:hypothetical protein